jgi:hypothetical protein
VSRACLRLAGMASTGGESWKENSCEIDVSYRVHHTISVLRSLNSHKEWSDPRIIFVFVLQTLICVCASDSFVCGPRIKFCALAQMWVVTQSLVSDKWSEWLTPW